MSCRAVEPNQSLANAAICDRWEGHAGWHEGYACGPARAERPGRHRWASIDVDTPLPGDRWRFTHHGYDFDVEVTELRLDGDVVHGKLLVNTIVGKVGDLMIAPAASVRSGHRVTE